jgi:uncharacterized protein YoxC
MEMRHLAQVQQLMKEFKENIGPLREEVKTLAERNNSLVEGNEKLAGDNRAQVEEIKSQAEEVKPSSVRVADLWRQPVAVRSGDQACIRIRHFESEYSVPAVTTSFGC